MSKYEHLHLPLYQNDIERKKKRTGFSKFRIPEGRNKQEFSSSGKAKAREISDSFKEVKRKFLGRINPNLIFSIKINDSVDTKTFEKILSSMEIKVLSVAENKKGYWVVFSDDSELSEFRFKLDTYGSEEGPKYDFFNAIDSFEDIPKEQKIGKKLSESPLTNISDFIDVELWRMETSNKNEYFINELKHAYPDHLKFRITDQLITKSFVLIRVKLTKEIFDEIIELKEIARADRPTIPTFNPFEYKNITIDDMQINPPDENAHGILIVDSGIVSGHPLLSKTVGDEQNFQDKEQEIQDTVGHGTAVAGCAAYGDIEKCIENKIFTSSNWIFSAKVMYAVKDEYTGEILRAEYDKEKLPEHQLKDAVEYFISKPEYHIQVINIALGDSNEVWQKDYHRQLPLAALIDELAYTYPDIVFIVSAGNKNPLDIYDNISDIIDNYPKYLIENDNFRIINPATSALALTVGSIADKLKIQKDLDLLFIQTSKESIKTPIAQENQPSPFTRTGPGINGMIKPELVECGGNLVLYEKYGRIIEDWGGRISVLSNNITDNLIRFDYGTSFSAPKVAHIAGQIANRFSNRSANFIKNMLLASAHYPFPDKNFYIDGGKDKNLKGLCEKAVGYGVPDFDRAINSYDNRAVLFDEGKIGMNKVKVYSLELPEIFFREAGRKRITITLTFNPETRSSRGDSYLGNRMKFHLFHSLNPQIILEKYADITDEESVPDEIKKCEIKFVGTDTREAGCHQKAWKAYLREPRNIPSTPISLILLNINKWTNENRMQDYCISVIFEHEKDIKLYAQLRSQIQQKIRIKA